MAGCSGSGKTSLARRLADRYGVPCLSLDSFFLRGAPRRYVETGAGPVRSFEYPSQYDGAALAAAASKHGSFIIEGFALLTYPEITALAPLALYVDVPFEVCLARRLRRTPHRRSDESFAIIGREETARWVAPQRLLPSVRVLDGHTSPDKLFDAAVAVIDQHINPS